MTKKWTAYLEVDPKTEEAMDATTENPEVAVLLESLVSTWIAAKNKFERADVYTKTQAGDRDEIRLMLAHTLVNAQPDPTRWEAMPQAMKYDEYLLNRRSIGKLTKLDLTRTGLKRSDFSDELSYRSHMGRLQQAKPPQSGVVKDCRVCGHTLPREKFGSGKTLGQGLVCNACAQRLKRERRKAGDVAVKQSTQREIDLEKGYEQWLAEKEARDAASD